MGFFDTIFKPVNWAMGQTTKVLNAGMKPGEWVKDSIDSWTGKYQTDKTNQANLELAQYQYGQEQKMWEQQNAWNSPASQMQRLKDAGLNPALMYGQGTTGNAVQIPKYQAPKMDYSGYQPKQAVEAVTNTIGAYMDFKLRNAQVDNAEQMNKNIMQDTIRKGIENEILVATAPWKKQYGQLDYEKKGWDIDVLRKRSSLMDMDYVLKGYQGEILDIKNKQYIKDLQTTDLKQQGISLDNEFKKYRNDLAKMGIYSGDSYAFRVLIRMLSESGKSLKDFFDKTFFPKDIYGTKNLYPGAIVNEK